MKTPEERWERFDRELSMRRRLDRAAWRLQAAETERLWAIVSASERGQSVRKIAEAVGLSPTRVHQILKDADHDAIAEQASELREQGWPDVDSDGKDDGIADLIGERIADEASALRDCARWLEALNNDKVVVENLNPARFERRDNVRFTPERVQAIIERIAFDLDELAKARRVIDCDDTSLEDPHVRRRRRLAEDPVNVKRLLDVEEVLHQRHIYTSDLHERLHGPDRAFW